MQTNRSWFPYISVGLTVLLALVFATKFWGDDVKSFTTERSQSPTTSEQSSSQGSVTEESYKAAVTTILATYTEDSNPKATYNALVILRVPESMQQVHFDLVVAMGKLAAGDKTDGEARLSALKAENSWLPL